MNRHFWWFTLQKYSKSSGVHEVDEKENNVHLVRKEHSLDGNALCINRKNTEKTQKKTPKKSPKKNEVDIKSLAIIHLTNRETIPKSIPLSPLNRLFILVLYHQTSPLF